ncbi:MAG TPA: hypothetical protein VE267_14495 [Bradyrhizobium sp.]|nr:hypothetical protein [Bradyrhizobium sp.]
MKFAPCISFAVAMTGSLSAFAAVEQCRFIEARPEREACYQRQEIARAEKQKAHDAAQQRPADPIEPRDDQVAKSLRSICRGC